METLNSKYLTEPQQKALDSMLAGFSSLLAQRDRAWINLLRHTGMRITEFSLMTVCDAKFGIDSGWLFIPKERRKGKRADLSVRVSKPVREDLEQLLRLHAELGGAGGDDDPLVYSRKHQRMSVRAYQERISHWCRLCGFRATPHYMRHTRAMKLINTTKCNDPRRLVMQALGHINIQSSAIYTRWNKEDLAREIDAVDGGPKVPKKDVRKAYEARW